MRLSNISSIEVSPCSRSKTFCEHRGPAPVFPAQCDSSKILKIFLKLFRKFFPIFCFLRFSEKKTPFGVQTVTSLIISFGPCKRMRDFTVTENDLRYFSALCDLSKIFSKLIFLSTIFDYLMFSVMKTHSRDLRATLSITFWSCGTNETFLNNFGKDLCFFKHCDYSKKNLFGQMGNTTLS